MTEPSITTSTSKFVDSSLLACDNINPVIEQGYVSAKEQLADLFPDGF